MVATNTTDIQKQVHSTLSMPVGNFTSAVPATTPGPTSKQVETQINPACGVLNFEVILILTDTAELTELATMIETTAEEQQ